MKVSRASSQNLFAFIEDREPHFPRIIAAQAADRKTKTGMASDPSPGDPGAAGGNGRCGSLTVSGLQRGRFDGLRQDQRRHWRWPRALAVRGLAYLGGERSRDAGQLDRKVK